MALILFLSYERLDKPFLTNEMIPARTVPVKLSASVWTRLKEGDSYSLGELYDSQIQDLYKFGKRLCADEDMLADALHDVFEDIWNYRTSIAVVEVSNIPFYLRKALKTKLLKYLNRQSKHTEFAEYEEYEQGFAESAETSLIAAEADNYQHDRLAQQISLLPKRQQEALRLRFYDNLSYNEIAELMALTQHSVYNLIYKSISQLRENLAFNLALLITAENFFNFF